MGTNRLRIGITGCGTAAQVHLDRLLALDGVEVVGCSDVDLAAAEAMAAQVPSTRGGPAAAFDDHRELLRQCSPDALAVITPRPAYYRPAMDALQAGCHVLLEPPLSTIVQEAVDVIGLARGRGRKVGVGHQYRLRPSLAEARRSLADGAIGPVRLVTALLAEPCLANQSGTENSGRIDPRGGGDGVLGDAGEHLVDALLWITGQVATEAAAIQARHTEKGPDVVTAAVVRLADGTPVSLAISGVAHRSLFEITFHGESGRLRATDATLEHEGDGGPLRTVPLPSSGEGENIDRNFVSAVVENSPLCCPAEQALDTVRLLEAIARSATTGQVVRLA